MKCDMFTKTYHTDATFYMKKGKSMKAANIVDAKAIGVMAGALKDFLVSRTVHKIAVMLREEYKVQIATEYEDPPEFAVLSVKEMMDMFPVMNILTCVEGGEDVRDHENNCRALAVDACLEAGFSYKTVLLAYKLLEHIEADQERSLAMYNSSAMDVLSSDDDDYDDCEIIDIKSRMPTVH